MAAKKGALAGEGEKEEEEAKWNYSGTKPQTKWFLFPRILLGNKVEQNGLYCVRDMPHTIYDPQSL